jgi:hypothetical protein
MWVAERAIGLTIVGIFAEQLNYFLFLEIYSRSAGLSNRLAAE